MAAQLYFLLRSGIFLQEGQGEYEQGVWRKEAKSELSLRKLRPDKCWVQRLLADVAYNSNA